MRLDDARIGRSWMETTDASNGYLKRAQNRYFSALDALSSFQTIAMTTPERQLEDHLIEKLCGLKYEYRADIRDRAALEQNFREKFEALNQVRLTDGEFARLLEEIVTADVFAAAKTLRSINAFIRDDDTPLN